MARQAHESFRPSLVVWPTWTIGVYVRHAFNGLVAVTLALVLAACSGAVERDPASRDFAEVVDTSRPDASTGALAPKVAKPLRTESFVAGPCRAITADQAGGLGLTMPGEKASNAASSSCLWWTRDKRTSVAVSYLTALTAGLSELYAQHEKDPTAFKYFEPATVAGYPALYADKFSEVISARSAQAFDCRC